MSEQRYLTKSRFKLGVECPTKLYYTGKKEVYADQKLDDRFLEELANGGYQIGELAKHYFPGGVEIGRGFAGDALAETRRMIESGDGIIYEAAFQAEGYFIYADIVEVKDGVIFLYEVKSKSFDPLSDSFTKKRGNGLIADWIPYLNDVAFQKMVIRKAFPEREVRAHLALVDKSQRCPTDGLNQKFRVSRTPDGTNVTVSGLTAEDLAVRLLRVENVDEICDGLIDGDLFESPLGLTFEGTAKALAEHYARDEKMTPRATAACAKCEFRSSGVQSALGLQDGFRECWSEIFGWGDEHFALQSVLDVWDLKCKDKLIAEGRVSIDQVTEADLNLKEPGHPGLSRTQRQLLQITKACSNDPECHIDGAGLAAEFGSWQFPLHFIDFETSMPAIPYNAGRRPYEGIAFQFSHHVVYGDGTLEHKGEFLNISPGRFPNFDFIRALKAELEADDGTVFQYSKFENTYLNLVYRQLLEIETTDRAELLEFIREIATANDRTKAIGEDWADGPRTMVDMLQLVKRYYYDPATRGSNSIKQVLPAILNSSPYLQAKYEQPIYGASSGIPSLNFKDHAWVRFENGSVADPYTLLEKIFADISDKDLDLLLNDDDIRDGAAAMTAYAKLQFEDMPAEVRTAIQAGLLRYCELDSLAMVMIYEGWREMIYGNR
ncbi:MAG: DUF2779 domain-containing protein [Pyrinomonadaceae bacterium]